MYSRTTNSIKVNVEPFYLDDQSEPEKNYYVWAYQIKIENLGDHRVKLKNRHWTITDAYGRIHEVKGEGVVGEQPELNPGESFEYTSGTPLDTPSGIMSGTYEMIADDGSVMDIVIPAFSLDSPYENVVLN